MNRNKIIPILLVFSIFAPFITGCSSNSSKLTDDQKIETLNEIKLYEVKGDKTLSELEKLIDKNIDNYEIEDRDIAIDKYISSLYSTVGNLSKTLSIIGYELEDVISKYNVDVKNKKTFKNIPETNATIRGFLEEVNSKGFTLEKPDGAQTYTVSIDSVSLRDKYSKNVSKSYSKFLEFNAYESTGKDFSNIESRTIDLDEVAKRIVMIEDGLDSDKEQNYKYASRWMNAMTFYYPILMGTSHDYFISTDYLKDDILIKYKELSETYKDKQIGQILSEIIDIYEESSKKADNETVKKISLVLENELFTEDIKESINNNSTMSGIDREIESEDSNEP